MPADVYPVGRLDFDSEGLLLLTNDSTMNFKLLNPSQHHEREYWVQVEGLINDEAIDLLRNGVTISVDGKSIRTKKSVALRMEPSPPVPPRNPPIRFRKNIPDSWLSLILTEGRNRQVRKMTASVGFPTLRLIRYRIERLTLEGLEPGDMRELSRKEIYDALFHNETR